MLSLDSGHDLMPAMRLQQTDDVITLNGLTHVLFTLQGVLFPNLMYYLHFHSSVKAQVSKIEFITPKVILINNKI